MVWTLSPQMVKAGVLVEKKLLVIEEAPIKPISHIGLTPPIIWLGEAIFNKSNTKLP